MVILYSHLQTCKECWKRGDKRIDESIAKMIEGDKTTGQTGSKEEEETSQGAEAHDKPDKCTCENMQRRSDRTGDERDGIIQRLGEEDGTADNDITHTNPSRPQTPITDYDLDPDNLPWYLLHYEYYCDLSRPCHPGGGGKGIVMTSSFGDMKPMTLRWDESEMQT
ncbi:hypothetical protein N7466_009364 [Penicillium verhagenii]|uniref:uncharacterized protein n=1 Tax=Penicillium verhagenii TaxID=1562060 RepID=UPI002545B60F|nr:uncharacterized protein N7466_009364 [Penicillium verhagenii]KAJ5921038.1 hypothetical protein N7466_009364 [Penicillium verhagenii]